MNGGCRILLVEDEAGLVMTVGDRLIASGYRLDVAESGEKALQHFGPEQPPPDLVVLDIMLPGIDGFEVCRALRARGWDGPVLMLTARGAVTDRVRGLKTGADDYLCKPFAMQELVARVEALLRRTHVDTSTGDARVSQASGTVSASVSDTDRIGRHVFDRAARQLVAADGTATELSATEFRLLAVFVDHPGRVLSREELLDAAWGYNNETSTRTVDVHVAWLRAKLGEADHPRHIVTVRRGGYRFDP